jgi:hypothetical protein
MKIISLFQDLVVLKNLTIKGKLSFDDSALVFSIDASAN